MTREEAIKMAKADLKCAERDTSGQDEMCNSHKCDECSLNYERGNIGEQKEWLRLAIKALEQEPKWIPVTERLPEEGYSVLVMRITDDNYKYMRVATYQGDCWMDNTDKFNKPNPHKVIAWMPLPQPYKAESEDEDGSNSKYGNA